MNKLLPKLLLASTASLTVTEAVNLEPLWNALITLAVSLLSVLTIEGIAWLRAWFKARTPKNNEDEKVEENKKED